MNMMSAFAHVVGDTLRTVAVFAAALVSSLTGYDADVCDAVSAIFAAITILFLCVPLTREVYVSVLDIRDSWDNEDEDGVGLGRVRRRSTMHSGIGGSSSSGGGSVGNSGSTAVGINEVAYGAVSDVEA